MHTAIPKFPRKKRLNTHSVTNFS